MASLKIILDAEGVWKDLAEASNQGALREGSDIQIGRLERGMASGKSSVAIRMELEDGSIVLGQTSMELFLACARAFSVKEEMSEPSDPTLN